MAHIKLLVYCRIWTKIVEQHYSTVHKRRRKRNSGCIRISLLFSPYQQSSQMLIVPRKYFFYIFHCPGDIYCMGDQLHVHGDALSGLKHCTQCDGRRVILDAIPFVPRVSILRYSTVISNE